MPSVVTLNKIIQRNDAVARAMRQLIEQSDDEKIAAAARTALDTQRREGDALCSEYTKFFSDAEDERRFRAADASRKEFLIAADKAIALAQGRKQAEAVAVMRAEVEPALDRTIDGFNADIDYNIELAEREAATAQKKVSSSFLTIGSTLALAGLLGTLMGWAISRAVTSSLGFISDALQEGATQTAAASSQLSARASRSRRAAASRASSVAETSAALEEMSVMIRSTAENADKAKDFAYQARGGCPVGAARRWRR